SGLATWCLPSMADSQRSRPPGRAERPRFCSQCGNPVVVADASFCKNCGAALSPTAWFSHDVSWRPMVAVLLSAIPGLGHWYKGQRLGGGIWFLFVILFLFLDPWPLGALLWLICAFNAGIAGALREDAVANATRRRWRYRRNHWRIGGAHRVPLQQAQKPGQLKGVSHRAS